MDIMYDKFKESFLIGFKFFLVPFMGCFLYTFYIAGWNLSAALISGLSLSTPLLAVVYLLLVETNLSITDIGKILMESTFITDMGTAITMSILFIKPTLYNAIYIIISIIIIFLAVKFSYKVFDNPILKNKVIEPELKYILLFLLIFIYFANIGSGYVVLPAFLLVLSMLKHFSETSYNKIVRNGFRIISYAVITPIFFILGGLKVLISLILSSFGFTVLFGIKIIFKFLGSIYFHKNIQHGSMYTTLFMSTGLTLGNIANVCGLNSRYINQ